MLNIISLADAIKGQFQIAVVVWEEHAFKALENSVAKPMQIGTSFILFLGHLMVSHRSACKM